MMGGWGDGVRVGGWKCRNDDSAAATSAAASSGDHESTALFNPHLIVPEHHIQFLLFIIDRLHIGHVLLVHLH